MRTFLNPILLSLLLGLPVQGAKGAGAEVPIRVGLDTQALEWVVRLDGGGQVCSRMGRVLMTLKPGEKLEGRCAPGWGVS
ncbi:MAG: hypothetical protein H6Q00_1950 [Holophagaceae bacterium]|nr:hypothetical protein [Holophagaceae bacterium]